MPDVVGLSQPKAEAELEEAGLEAEIEVKDIPKVEAGEVTEQSEEAGVKVDTGSTIILTVASGSVKLPVEELVGSSYKQARAKLAELGLEADPGEEGVHSRPGRGAGCCGPPPTASR